MAAIASFQAAESSCSPSLDIMTDPFHDAPFPAIQGYTSTTVMPSWASQAVALNLHQSPFRLAVQYLQPFYEIYFQYTLNLIF